MADANRMNRMNWLDITALVLVIIGALNWGLVGLFAFDLVAAVFGEATFLANAVYVIIGIAGLFVIWTTVKAGQAARTARPAPRRA